MGKFFWITFLLLFLPFKQAQASGCEKVYFPVEFDFLRYDVIFSGYVKPAHTVPRTEFDITEVFKDSIHGSDADIDGLKYYHGGPKYYFGVNLNMINPETEYIFYASFPDKDDEWKLEVSPCSKTRASPEGHVNQLKNWKPDQLYLDDRVQSTNFIFKGKLIHKDVNLKQGQKGFRKGKIFGEAKADFQVDEIFRNIETNRKDEDIDTVTIDIKACEKFYDLGGEYIVYASGGFSKEEDVKLKHGMFEDNCHVIQGANDWNIKAKLRELSRFNQKKSN